MDKDIFVQNVKILCLQKGIKPTNACKESGVGGSFLSDIQNRGSVPSVAKVQMLADYLGVTTSELLGETDRTGPGDKKGPTVKDDGLTEEERLLVLAYRAASEDDRAVVDAALRKYKPSAAEKKVM